MGLIHEALFCYSIPPAGTVLPISVLGAPYVQGAPGGQGLCTIHPECLARGLEFQKQPIECVLNRSTEDSDVCAGRVVWGLVTKERRDTKRLYMRNHCKTGPRSIGGERSEVTGHFQACCLGGRHVFPGKSGGMVDLEGPEVTSSDLEKGLLEWWWDEKLAFGNQR